MTLKYSNAAAPSEIQIDAEMSAEQEKEFLQLQSEANRVSIDQDLIQKINELLLKTDMIALRCLKSRVQFPQDWDEYTEKLRSVLRGDLKEIPDYPKDTYGKIKYPI